MTAKQKQEPAKHKQTSIERLLVAQTLLLAVAMTVSATAQTKQQTQRQYPASGSAFPAAPQLQLPRLPTPTPITPNGAVLEDVVVRINDQIITRSEYERSEQQMLQEAQQQNVSQADLQDHLKDLLRDMIDTQLLLSKGKELSITCDAETIRELDEIRKQNHLPDMEALEKAAAQQGISYEDFKQNIRSGCIRKTVVQEQVGRRINLSRAQEEAYYKAHTQEFVTPEQVHLSEILIPTPDGATDKQLAAAQAKADDVAAQLKSGAKFSDLAKTASGGPTAAAGGDLGDFKRGTLGQVLEDATFSLPAGGSTAPIRTKQGYVILRVDAHQAAGVQPMTAVESQLQEAIYMEQLQPALRAYLTKARNEAYMEIAAGFVDTGSTAKGNNANFAYTAYTPPAVKRKVQARQRIEQEKAAKAQTALAAARARVAEKQQAKAEADKAKLDGKPGAKTVSAKRQKRVPKEKIRYGQAPRNSLPTATTVAAAEASPPLTGAAPGVAMAPTESVTSITTGTGADVGDNPLGPVEGPTKKSRYSSQQTQAEVDRAKSKLGKAETKATIRPVSATRDQSATEKVQASPLGLSGDTVKKRKKPKAQKGDKKERLQEQQKPATTTPTVAPTVNPAVAGSPVATATPPQ